GDGRQDAPLHADHRADESVADDEQRELRGVLAKAQANGHLGGARGHLPALMARMRSISAGFGGTSPSASMNAGRSSESIRFHFFSKAMVLEGLPLIPAPQIDPEK